MAKITAGLVMSWIFGVLFLLAGIGLIGESFFGGATVILSSLLIIPYSNQLAKEHIDLELSGGAKFLLVIVILITFGLAMPDNYSSASEPGPSVTGEDSTVDQNQTPVVSADSATNPRTNYIKSSLELEEIKVDKGYGQYDVPGYSKEKDIVEGKLRNTGDRSLDVVEITIYFLDSAGNRIGEEQYYPVNTMAYSGDDSPLRPNYVRDWGYVVESDAPSDWDKTVEVAVTDVEFSDE